MTSFLAVVALGFFLGVRHATDPDHVVAVTTIVSRRRSVKGAVLVGAVWGLGHTLTLLVVGGGIVLFGWVIPPRVGLSLEFSVGVMLVVLGALNIASWVDRLPGRISTGEPDTPDSHHRHGGDRSLIEARPQTAPRPDAPDVHQAQREGSHHSHAHAHGDYVHTHAHGHDPERHPHDPERTPVGWLDRHFGSLRGYRLVRPLLIGVVHGLAGSAAVALLVLATIPEPTWGLLYLGVFGVGTIAGMVLVTSALGIPFALGARSATVHRRVRVAAGAISLVFGVLIAYEVGLVQGLFSAQPQWTPR